MSKRKKRLKKTSTDRKPDNLKPTELSQLQKGIAFSYKYLQEEHPKFSIRQRDIQYLIALLSRLKDLSSLSVQELKGNSSKTLRCHPIDWKDTSENSFGIPNEEQLVDGPYQFSLSANKHGRVHGFFIEQVFYIVWLDPEHQLYPSRK